MVIGCSGGAGAILREVSCYMKLNELTPRLQKFQQRRLGNLGINSSHTNDGPLKGPQLQALQSNGAAPLELTKQLCQFRIFLCCEELSQTDPNYSR